MTTNGSGVGGPRGGAPKSQHQTASASPQLKPAQQTATSIEQATAHRPLRTPGMPLMKPATPDIQAAPVGQAHLDMLARLEPLIAAQVQEVAAVMQAEGLGPADVQVVFSWDTNGDEKQVCSFCGREGCGYRPVMYKTKNTEIDLLEDSFVVATEVATRLGISWGAMVYDQDVLVLREVEQPSERAAKENMQMLDRWRAFVNRHNYPDPTNRAWLSERLAQWRPEHATATVMGQPDDKHMFNVAQRLLTAKKTGALAGLTVAKSQVPASSLKSQEPLFKAKKLRLHGLAVGSKADQIQAGMFRNTDNVPDAHVAREMVGKRIKSLIEKSTT